jgi:hypothetical protein
MIYACSIYAARSGCSHCAARSILFALLHRSHYAARYSAWSICLICAARSILLDLYCAIYTILALHHTLYAARSVLCTARSTMLVLHCSLYTARSLHFSICTVRSIQLTRSILLALYTIVLDLLCSFCTDLCSSLRNARSILLDQHCSLHTARSIALGPCSARSILLDLY